MLEEHETINELNNRTMSASEEELYSSCQKPVRNHRPIVSVYLPIHAVRCSYLSYDRCSFVVAGVVLVVVVCVIDPTEP